MTRRSAAALTLVSALLFPAAALADADAGTGDTDAGTTGTDAGTAAPDAGTAGTDAGTTGTDAGTPAPDAGTSGSGGVTVDPTCTITNQVRDGETCQVCQFTSSDMVCVGQLGSQYNFVCNYSPNVEVWCDGPSRVKTQDQGCAFGGAPAPAGGALLAALAGVAVWAKRRRRRA